ncbi:MAG: mandelate racemase/muconate lactonizing enzyme family protein [Rhizobiaceae bacterium]|nr:mandelate racemase/muconate lactonizing enzyme family protein [Rhizobiaceae bacterium]
MKIKSVESLCIDLSGADGIPLWCPVFARVTTEDGIVGLGELGMAYGSGAKAGPDMILALAERFLIGQNALETETIWETMLRRSFWAEGGGPIVFGAMSALDSALWDIKGKAAGLPVHRLLGAKTPAPLRTYASQLQFDWSDRVKNLTDPEEYRTVGQQVREQGYDCIKVDPLMVAPDGTRETNLRGYFEPSRRQMFRKRMEAMREGLGDDCDIIVELHSFTSTGTAVQIAELLQDLDIMYIEEPTHYNSPSAHLAFVQRSPVRVAMGERIYTRWGFQPYLEAGAVDMIQPDIGLAGGVSETKKIADLAHIYDVGVQVHVCGSPLSTAIALQVEAAIPNFIVHEHHTYALKDCNVSLFERDLQPENGRFAVPLEPGFGMELSKKAEQLAVVRSVG